MRVLVTGAAGFIGGAIRQRLIERGHEVVAVDAYLPSAHCAEGAHDDGIDAVDVRDHDRLARYLARVDAVCHQAAVVGVGQDAADAPAFASHNDFGTAVLLAAMAAAGCRRLVLASSMVVYGEGRYRTVDGVEATAPPRLRRDLDAGMFDVRHPVTGEPLIWQPVDEDAPLRPRSSYAASKLAQENYALSWSLATGGQVTALRYHNVYGANMPRNTPYSGVAAMFRSALESAHAPRVFEDGQQMRDFVEVGDVAAANLAALEQPLDGFTPINVCSGYPISIGEVARRLAAAVGGPEPVVTGQYRPGDVRHIVASPRRAEQRLGFRAAIHPAQGLTVFASAPLRPTTGTGRPSV